MRRVLDFLRKSPNKKFTTSDEIKEQSKKLFYDYNNVINYLTSQGYLMRIFDDIFYIKSRKEVLEEKIDFSLLELVAQALELKNINRWYFGLYTALKLNGVDTQSDHSNEFFIMSDRIFRRKPFRIAGYDFKFIKLKYVLLEFGVKENVVRFSDLEKTALDFIYLWKYNGIHPQKIIVEIGTLLKKTNKDKIFEYSRHYPEINQQILKDAYERMQN
ncbi:MAG: hypothetical protein P8Y70_04085 [Candidatus Lokiarchaeota archaeon]